MTRGRGGRLRGRERSENYTTCTSWRRHVLLVPALAEDGAPEAEVVRAAEEGVLEALLRRPALGAVEPARSEVSRQDDVCEEQAQAGERGREGGSRTHSRQRFMRSTTWNTSLPWYHSATLSSDAGIGPYGSGEFSTIMGGLSSRTSECRLACAVASYSRMLVSNVRSASERRRQSTSEREGEDAARR